MGLFGKNKIVAALETQRDFTPAVMFKSPTNKVGVAIDPARNKFAISYGDRTRVFDFDNLIAVEAIRNGTSIQKTNRGSQAAGAAVGAVLLGPVGLLAGALTGSKRNEQKVTRLSLKLFTTDLVEPVHEIMFVDLPGGIDPNHVRFVEKELDNWHGRFQAILHGRS